MKLKEIIEQKMPGKKAPEKCKTCPYALGYVQTLICPCPKCVGKTSIFGEGVPRPVIEENVGKS